MTFVSPTLGQISLPEVVARIHEYMAGSDRHNHKLIVGTDSAPAVAGQAEFISAIVVHRVGNGGIYFWRRTVKSNIHTLRDRMYHEALCSLELARTLVEGELLQPHLASRDALEVHIDIGEGGPTRDMIREIVGMVTGYGFRVKTKPDSFGANKVADRHT